MTKINEILDKKSILLNSDPMDKNEIIRNLVELAAESGKVPDKEAIYNEVIERESVMSTGIGNKIAIPHTKSDMIENITGALITFNKATNFDSLDGKYIRIAFLILSSNSDLGQHIKILSKVSRVLHIKSFQEQLLDAEKAVEVIKLFDNFEN